MPADPTGPNAAALVSGGLDSAVMCVDMLGRFERVFPIFVRFGLRWEDSELAALRAFLDAASNGRAGLRPLTVLDEPVADVYGEHWSTTGPDVPGDETPDESVYLPGRNVLLAAKAAVWCHLRGVDALAFGTLRGNPFPDSTPEFMRDMAAVLNQAVGGRITFLQPYTGLSKAEVLRRAGALPLHLTLSCLDPEGLRHCGRCNKCAERRKAFRDAGLPDPTRYAARFPADHAPPG